VPIPTAVERIGTCIEGRYELLAILARGGMGIVYEALDRSTEQQVVVKMPRPGESDDGAGHARFGREAALLRQLRHPNVVQLVGSGEADGVPYLVMERLEGQPLAELLMARGKLAADQALELLLPIMDAVARAHEAGIIHRDLKPSNVFVATDATGQLTPKLLDFGIAKALEGTTVTRTGRAVGTPDYMSPEQASGAPVDVRTDVWSMGMIVYRCLSGALPFDGPVHDTGRARVALQKRAPELPSRFAAAIDRALAFDAMERYASMRDFALALVLTASSAGMSVPASALSAARGLHSATSTVQRVRAGFAGTSSRRWIAAIVVGCVVLTTVAALVWSRGSSHPHLDDRSQLAPQQPAPTPTAIAPASQPAIVRVEQAAPPTQPAAPPAPEKPSARRAPKPSTARERPKPEQTEPAAPEPEQTENGLPAIETRW
jgi:serine/threonine-protein kinase